MFRHCTLPDCITIKDGNTEDYLYSSYTLNHFTSHTSFNFLSVAGGWLGCYKQLVNCVWCIKRSTCGTPALMKKMPNAPFWFCVNIRRCIQKYHDNAHNTQVACSSRVSRYGVLRWCLVSECAEWRGWMWKCLIVAHVFVCVLHQPSAIFWYRRYGGSWRTKGVHQVLCESG